MIKLVVSDLDGTLLKYGEECIKKHTIEKIEAVLSRGIYFAVSSGRTYTELCQYLPSFVDRIYFISSDGALVTFKDKIIFNKSFSHDAMNYAINSCGNSSLFFHGRDAVYSYKDSDKKFITAKSFLKPFEIKEPVYKIVAYGHGIPMFDGIHSRVHYSDGTISEYVPPFADKGVSLGALQRHLGVSIYETLAMGDSVNDIPMMKNAKYTYAIGKASSRLSSNCKFFSDTVDAVLEKVWINNNFDY